MSKRKFEDINPLSELKAGILALNKENAALQIGLWGEPHPNSSLIYLKALVEASYSMSSLKGSIQNSKISPRRKQTLLSGILELPEKKLAACSSQESEALLGIMTLNPQDPPNKRKEKPKNRSNHAEFLRAFSVIKTTLADQKSTTTTTNKSDTLDSSTQRFKLL